MWPAATVAALAACLSGDDGTGRMGEQSDSAGAGGAPGAGTAAIQLPPGGIVDTQPNSGWTEGSFSVNDNGAAEYHLPLWVPDGRGGLQPEIALHYNSQTGNGLVGVGWSLVAGLSSITPCARTLAQDGRVENPGFARNDAAYCLDGQRLRPAEGGGPLEQDYRTEQDTFARIRAYETPEETDDPPAYFKVWTKDGRILTYDAPLRAYGVFGANRSGSIEEPSVDHTPDRATAAWALRTIEDRNGNSMTIEYETIEGTEQDQWSVEMVPHAITYGPNRKVEFLYEDREDPVNTFRAGTGTGTFGPFPSVYGGVHTELGRVLKTIRMTTGTTLLREYTLLYQQSNITGRSELGTVTECDGGSSSTPPVCLDSLQFDWSHGSTTSYAVVDTDITDVALAAWGKHYYIPGDIDGDGRDDLVYRDQDNNWKMRFSTGEGFTAAQDTGIPRVRADYDPQVRPIDFDRDGRMDLMVEVPRTGITTKLTLFRSTGTTYQEVFSDDVGMWKSTNGDILGGIWGGFFADLDGNGLPDYIAPVLEQRPDRQPDNVLRWRYALNSESGFGPIRSQTEFQRTDGPLDSWFSGQVPYDYQIRTAYIDGPLAHPVYWSPGPQHIAYGSPILDAIPPIGLALLNIPFQREPENTDRRNLHFADVNGDGLEDAVYPCTGMKVQLAIGGGFSGLIDGPPDVAPCPIVADDNIRVRVADFTGDGSDDLLLIHTGRPTDGTDYQHGIQLYTWTGRGLTRRSTMVASTPVWDSSPLAAIQPLDFNGDGLMDL
ncbi:MAG TPA: FG-GAP-like repeat-containing protein, partial [Kofleriaceae bacterium]|nr:FG-GAP-like repeat-containing protein [Kofleriaceae bacterium]